MTPMSKSVVAICSVAILSACSADAPPGVDKAVLDKAVSDAIGDPGTCVLIGKAGSGEVVYRYNTHTACGRSLPMCEAAGTQTPNDLLRRSAKDGQVHVSSCDTAADGSRGVGWAAGPIAGKPLVYAAMMEGNRAFPGRMMADKLARAFHKAGL